MLLLSINPTETSPCIMLDTDTNIFEISGSSRPENISAFYKPIINTIENYFQLMLQKKLQMNKFLLYVISNSIISIPGHRILLLICFSFLL